MENLLVLITMGIVIYFFLMALVRNYQVYKEQLRVIDVIHGLSNLDIDRGDDWEWRYDEFNAMSYNKMLLEFWKPVSSFFANSKCCQDYRRRMH